MQDALSYDDIERSVFTQDEEGFAEAIERAISRNPGHTAIRQAMLNGLDRVRKRLLSNESSLPELLISLDMTTNGLDALQQTRMGSVEDANLVSLVIGVVPGDPHDLGKNIISLLYRSYGYQVTDLGSQVEKEAFVETVREVKAQVLALSAMMSTTTSLMPEIIREVKMASPETLVIVGGAPLDDTLAQSYGADGYADSAVTVFEETQKMLAKVGEVN